jgi:2-C-methyl-D-erythritol 4-phosphate cytidylyltransferase
MKVVAIIVAGGIGKRFGNNRPKQFIELGSKPIISYTLEKFQSSTKVNGIVIAVHSEWYNYTKELVEQSNLSKVVNIVLGGKSRQESVASALRVQQVQESEIVLIHDAVRPFLTVELIDKVVDTTEEYGAVLPCIQVKDTIKEIRSGTIKTLDRSKLLSAQTPQGFWTDSITNAMNEAIAVNFEATDDASLLEFKGFKIKNIDGEENNIKITTPLDLKLGEILLGL